MHDPSWTFNFKDPHWGTFEENRQNESRSRYNIRGHVWFYVLIEVLDGQILYHNGEELIDFKLKRYGLYMPSWSLSFGIFNNATYKIIGCWSDIPLPEKYDSEELSKPFIFEPAAWEVPQSREEAIKLLKAAKIISYVDRCHKANVVTRKTKKIIDHEYDKGVKIGTIASRLNLSGARISSSFQKDLGLSPIDYRNLLRSLVSIYYISQGRKVEEISRIVGFETQSRYHSSAKKFLMAAPRKFRK